MEDPLFSLIAQQQLIAGFVISLFGAIVAAGHTYSKERKNIPPTFNWIDFVFLVISGSFSGFIGFLLASWQIEEFYLILAIAGLSAIGGYGMLVSLKDIFIDVLKNRITSENKQDSN